MVVLGVVEVRRRQDLGRDLAAAGGGQRGLVALGRGGGGGGLRVGRRVDPGAVLGADVVALAHALRRVVGLPEAREQVLEGDLRRAVDDEHDLVVAGPRGADLLVGRVRRQARGVADGGRVDAGRLPEDAARRPRSSRGRR